MMSQHSQHSQTNGASLEDCHTNFFTLTDLCGIKWRVFKWENAGEIDPLEDPVLVSYSRCLSADVLCVWRRTWQSQPQSAGLDITGLHPLLAPHPPQSGNLHRHSLRHCPKELWVFWYGDEPDLTTLVSPELTKADENKGSWDWETGLSYECRTILFKALHNLIERCLLTRDFVRLGKWFVQPYDGPKPVSNKNTHLSFSLSFFVHGETTVCASVDVRQHPPVRRLSRKHLLLAQQTSQSIPVILAPYGLKGSLTGVTYKNSESQTQNLLDEWKHFFPLDSPSCTTTSSNPKDSASGDSSIPAVVEVHTGGYRLRYPSCYVLVTDMDEDLLPAQETGTTHNAHAASGATASCKDGNHGESILDEELSQSSLADAFHATISPFTASNHTLLSSGYIQKGGKGLGWSRDMGEHVWQDVVQCPSTQPTSHNDGLTPDGVMTPAELAGQWEFSDPAIKVNCSCSKFGSGNSANMNTSNSFNGYKASSVVTPGSVPSLRMMGVVDGHPPSVESPMSVTPSPLPTPRTPQSQPPSVPHHDQSMPLLSPHPPPSNTSMGDPTTPAPIDSIDNKNIALETLGPKSTSTVVSQGMSPYPGSVEGNTKQNSECNDMAVDQTFPDTNNKSNLLLPNSDGTSQHLSPSGAVGLRKPILPQSDIHHKSDLEESLMNVYDTSKFSAWLQHPVKKFRPVEPKADDPLWPPYRPPHMAQKFDIRFEPKIEVKLEPDTLGSSNGKRIGGVKRLADPYDFDDDIIGGGSSSIDTFKIKEERDDSKPPGSIKSTPDPMSPNRKIGNLYTVEGITPKPSDLDEIFDSPPVDDYPVQTPPGSNKPSSVPEDTSSLIPQQKSVNATSANPKNGSNTNFEFITKMYPTPPSLEHNPDHDHVEEGPVNVSIKQEPYDEMMQTIHDTYLCREDPDIKEPPLVFKPVHVAPFIGSDKYKPLTDLPSRQDKEILNLPPDLIYNPSWQQFPTCSEKSSSQSIRQNHSTPHSHQNLPPQPMNNSVSSLGSSVLPIPNGPTSGPRIGMSPISPATSNLVECSISQKGPASVGGPSSAGPSVNYELPSPASNHSSYLNRTLPSVEPPCVPSLQVPEANSLLTNVVLQDSSINLFRDHNFDSCTMCLCAMCGQKVVGSIRGSDGTLYLPPSNLSSEEEMILCKCGFSAVVNRRLAFQSGLFYEDEVDLTGLHEELLNERKKTSLQSLLDNKSVENSDRDICSIDNVPQHILELVQNQGLVTLCTPSSVLCRSVSVYQSRKRDNFNIVDYKDSNEMAFIALEQSRVDFSTHLHLHESDLHASSPVRNQLMHKWCYIQFDGPTCSQDMVRCMKALQPYLQEAIQKKRNTRLWEPVFNVSGPLTWRQFHRKALRGTEDMAGPLPIPLLLTGHEKDWLSVAPQSIKQWEKLLLEPYSHPRNVAYVVVSPDNELILNHVRSFFKELSSIYELCQLGRHAPIRRVLVDGIMRVSKRAASKVANESMDDWFTLLGDSQIFTKLKIYSQICCHTLAPHLTTLSLDKSLFEVGNNRATEQKQTPSPMPPPSGVGASSGSSNTNGSNCNSSGASSNLTEAEIPQNQPNANAGATPANFGPGSSLIEVEEDDSPPPAIMVYLIDPFTVGQKHPDMHRLITLGLLRCYRAMLEKLPGSMQNHVYVQIISLESILELARESHDKSKRIDQLKSLAFSVFMQCRRILSHTSNVKSLTGFGPAAKFDSFLRPVKDLEERSLHPYPVFSPAYILAPVKESRGRHKEAEEALGDPREKSTVLYCTYCLSEDQRWLLASITDELGEILEVVSINIEIPNRTRRKKASSRRHGLRKLMDWILGVMSIGVHPWRLVIGRLGRIGHGELKGWLSLLSRKSLALASKNLKEMCKQCSYLFPGDAPCILSACVVSLEPDSTFRMMPDLFTPDERFGQSSQNCNLSTPQDATCTHILVFPTSATAQTAQQIHQDDSTFELEENALLEGIGGEDHFGFLGVIFGDDNGQPQGIDAMEDGSVQQDSLSQSGSPIAPGVIGGSSPSQYNCQARSNGVVMLDPQDDPVNPGLQLQPLALGYYVSTASTGKLPHWFWSSCPHLESSCPTFLKSALHLNMPAVTQAEDYVHNTTTKVHPLDTSKTADVLRYVLEGYNSLSWLVLDPATQDRRSCLPLHMQVLSHLYNLMASLI